MAGANGNVEMMVSVLPGTMTGFASLNAGLASINNSFLNMTQAISDNFGLVETAVITTGVVIAQTAADAASAFGDFEQSMKIVQMVSGQTSDQIAQLGQAANQFSVQYRMDIDQITEGLQTLGRAGLNSASEQTEVLKNGLNTAKLEGRDLNDVLEELIQNTALLGGDLKSDQFGEQSEYLNNVMIATSLSAPITTHDVSETLKYSGGIAAAAGANVETEEGKALLEDYMGTIAAFAQKGVTGSIAGTALRAFFNKPATQDSSVLEGLATIKLKPEYLWEDDQQTMKPISEQINIIQKQMDKLNIPTMDRLQIWSKIVGGKMGQQMMKLDSSDIKNLTKDIRDAEDAESLANKSMQTYNANVNELSQRGQAAFRDFGSKIVYFLNPVLETINRIMDAFDKMFGGFGTDIASSALFLGLIGFLRKFAMLVKQTISGISQGLANIWRDYKEGNRFSIRDYRGNQGKVSINRDGETYIEQSSGSKSGGVPQVDYASAKNPKDLLSKWQNDTKEWRAFQEGKLSVNQYGALLKTQSWTAAKDNGLGIPDNEMIKKLVMDNLLPQHVLDDLKSMNKGAFMNEYRDALEDMYYEAYSVAEDAKKNVPPTPETSPSYEEAQRRSHDRKRERYERELKEKELKEKQDAAKEAHEERVRQNKQRQIQEERKRKRLENQADYNTAAFFDWADEQSPIRQESEFTRFDGNVYTRAGGGPRRKGSSVTIDDLDVTNAITNALEEYKRDSRLDRMAETDTRNRALDIDNKMQSEGVKRIQTSPTTSIEHLLNGLGEMPPLPSDIQAGLDKYNEEDPRYNQYVEDRIIQGELQRKELMEEELMLERQIADNRKALHDKQSEHMGSSAFVSAERGEEIRRESKEQSDAAKEKIKADREAAAAQNEATKYLKDSAKRNSASANLSESEARRQRDEAILARARREKEAWEEEKKANAKINSVKSDYAQSLEKAQNSIALANLSQQKAMEAKAEKAKSGGSKDSILNTIKSSMKESMFSREGQRFNFKPQNYTGIAKAGRMAGNALMNLADFAGGPLMVAFMGLQMAISVVQQMYENYQKSLQEAEERMNEAYTGLEEAENNLRTTITDYNPDLDEDAVNQMVYDTYAQMHDVMSDAFNNGYQKWADAKTQQSEGLPKYEYDEEADDGSMKKVEEELTTEEQYTKELDKNTRALYAATAELNAATNVYVSKATDKTWGIDGLSTYISDHGMDWVKPFSPFLMGASLLTPEEGEWGSTGTWRMTNSQKDEHYQGYTEMVGLMLEDFKDANGNWIAGLRTMMGDSVEEFSRVISPKGFDQLKDMAQFSSRMGADSNLRLQQSMKRDKKTWQSLAKEIAKQEKKAGVSPMKGKTDNKKLEGLVAKLQATTGGGFNRTQILQAAYMQQMQDMLTVAQQMILPVIQNEMQIAAQHLMTGQSMNANVQGTGSSTYTTAANAAIIAAYVAQMAKAEAGKALYNEYLALDPTSSPENKKKYELAEGSKDADDFMKKVSRLNYGYDNIFEAAWNGASLSPTDILTGIIAPVGKSPIGYGIDQTYMNDWLATFYKGTKQATYGYTPTDEQARAVVKEYRDKGMTAAQLFEDIEKNYQSPQFLGAVEAAYLASDTGEDTGSGSDGGGGGSGGGSDKDDDKKSKKERVDLVLCNKKEIPKLNVNLFKKPPSFTVLNKNFKLRDIKVNTQDKPKAVLSSIKNAIIDVQKRSDPKIIQDEAAEYDPVSATDGNSVPSGSTNTSTT